MKKNNNRKKEIGPIGVTFFAVIISFVVVALIFFFQNECLDLELFLPKKKETINSLLDKGKIDEVIKEIKSKPEVVQNSDSMLFLLGKALYLSAWQRNENQNWANYAKNPDDWFLGKDVEMSLHYLTRAAESPNTFFQATTLIGVIYMEKGWFHKAKDTFTRILRKDASQRDAYLYYGVVLSRIGQTKAAIIHLEKWQNYQNDPDFLKNLFYLYLFNERDYEKSAVLGDMFLKTAARGNPDIPKIIRELNDLSARFPEYFNDTMKVIKDRPPEFIRKKR